MVKETASQAEVTSPAPVSVPVELTPICLQGAALSPCLGGGDAIREGRGGIVREVLKVWLHLCPAAQHPELLQAIVSFHL